MTIKKADFSKICRMCLEPTSDLINFNNNSEVIAMIQNCMDIKVAIFDDLPQNICNGCCDRINKFSMFRDICKSSDTLLHQILLETLEEPIDEEDLPLSDIKPKYIDKEVEHTELNIKDESPIPSSPPRCLNSDNEDHNSPKSEIADDISDLLKTLDRNSNEKVSCIVCNKILPESSLIAHLRRHKKDKKHQCKKCNKAYREPCELAKHLRLAHHEKSTLKCEECSQTFQLQAQLDYHLKRHIKKMYPCSTCNKEFSSNAKLKSHMDTHQKREKRFFCLQCDSTFFRENSLNMHVKNFHSDKPQERQPCPQCGKLVYSIRLHILHTHSTVRPHKCDQCERAFTFKSVLMKHYREKHLGIKQDLKALCPTCGKSCPSQGDLRKHMQTHTDGQNFSCYLCEKRYKTRDGLRTHLRVHADMRPYKCEYCSKGFHTNTILTNHLRTHTGEKPFVCHICSRGFTQKVALKTHMKVHTVCIKLSKKDPSNPA